MRVAIISMTECVVTSDSRIFREAVSLKEAGHDVRVYGILLPRSYSGPQNEEYKGIKIQRILMVGQKQIVLLRLVRMFYLLLLLKPLMRRIPLVWRRRLGIAFFPLKYALKYMERLEYTVSLKYLGILMSYKATYAPLREFRPEVVHAHDLYTMPLAYFCKLAMKSRMIYDNHELWLERNVGGGLPRFWQAMESFGERFLIHKADAVLVVGDAIAGIMWRRYGVPITTLYNYPIPKKRTHSLREHLSIPQGQKLILYLGLITPNRGVEQAIQVLKHLPGYVLVMVGYFLEDWYQLSMEELIRKEDVGERVYFMPAVPFDEVTSWASSADVGVMFQSAKYRSYELSFPNKLLESVAAGLPVVVNAQCSEMLKFVNKHDIGLGVDINDIPEVAKGIDLVASTPRFALNSGVLAKSIDWNEEAKKLLRIYEKLKK